MKPFRPPLLKHRPQPIENGPVPCIDEKVAEPFPKRRKISQDADDDYIAGRDSVTSCSRTSSIPHGQAATRRPSVAARKPLVARNPPSPERSHNGHGGPEGYYLVLWRKPTAKKNKTWDGDGVLCIWDGIARLQDTDGKEMGRLGHDGPLLPGSTMSIGGKDVEIDSMISRDDYIGRRASSKAQKVRLSEPKPTVDRKNDATVSIKSEFGHRPPASRISDAQQRKSLDGKNVQREKKEESTKMLNIAASKTSATSAAFKNPLRGRTVMPQKSGSLPTPRHDPAAKGSIVMRRPKATQGKEVVDVVIDPELGRKLRDHQIEGVKFLYECVMGIRDYGGEGAILADEMGLGKTLQTITLLWTLLKQNPLYSDPPKPVVKKALIVCPVTLIDNWRKEFRKWLGNERIGVFIADGKKTRLTDFTMGKAYSVMIIGYERLRTVAEDLSRGSGIDIVIADEGHRLKTVQNKSAQAIQSLNTPRRIILSGTPIQNDLTEFYSMVNFVNDGILGSYKSFVKSFETPILKSRQPNAIEKDIENGEAMSEELASLTSPFILRRTVDILEKFLPSKTEYVLFVNPTPTQATIYLSVLASPLFQFALGNSNASESALQLITILKKLCNSPSLLNPTATAKASADDPSNSSTSTSLNSLLSTLSSSTRRLLTPASSAKIRLLDSLLISLRTHSPTERIVLVSNYTTTLNLLQTLLASLSLPFLRLDGSTPPAKRQALVDDFNRPTSNVFAFLLSAKAGGLGLNLVGASRLVLFDVDWNPATDAQSMARVWRVGQRRECRIYRFVCKGGVEERIWMRQVEKGGLASSVLDLGGRGGVGAGVGGGGSGGKKGALAQFSREELRDLFRFEEGKGLKVHELIGCGCGGMGKTTDLATIAEEGCKEDGDRPSDPRTREEAEKSSPMADDHILPSKPQLRRKRKKIQGKKARRLQILDSDSNSDSGHNSPDAANSISPSSGTSDNEADDSDGLPSSDSLLAPTTTTLTLTNASSLNMEDQERLIASGQHPLQNRNRNRNRNRHQRRTCTSTSTSRDGGGGDAASLSLLVRDYQHFDLSLPLPLPLPQAESKGGGRAGLGLGLGLDLGDEVLERALGLGEAGDGDEGGDGEGLGLGLGLVGWVFRKGVGPAAAAAAKIVAEEGMEARAETEEAIG